MKVRIKFSKTGALKFIGHLDVMRYFQKLMRRADIPISYSEGFSPHQIMSFAMPLGIGDESIGEYVDIELSESISSKEAISKLNEKSVPEIQVLSFREIPDGKATNAMSSITAALYEVGFREEYTPSFDIKNAFLNLLNNECINVVKQSKKSTTELDIKPFVYNASFDNNKFTLLLSCGSVMNIKPELFIKAVYDYAGIDFDEYYLLIKRIEMYTGEKDKLISLNDIGKDIE